MVKKIGPLSLAVPEEDTTVDIEAGDDAVDDGGEPTPGAVSGPLAMTNDPKQYNATMQMLLGQLVDTPEQQRKNETLAWSSGMVDPSGQGNLSAIIGNSSKAELAYRLKDKELRAQYIPAIMQALGTTQKAGGLDLSNINFRGMPEEEVARLSVAAKRDLLPYWKQANIGTVQEGGTFTLKMNPTTRQMEKVYTADPVKGVDVKNGVVAPMPGAPETQATLAGAVTEATEKAKAGWQQVKVVGPDNTEYTMYQSQANPQLFSKDAKGSGPAQLPPGLKITPVGGAGSTGGTPPGDGGTGTTAQGNGGPRTLTDAVAYVESTGDNSKVNPLSGAKGAMQVIDSTNGKPGYGVAPAKDNSIEERNRVGRDLLAAWQKQYGDNGGLVAYNWGPGHYERWKAAGSKWSDLPKETQEYIGKVNLAKEGHNIYGGKPATTASPQVAAPATAQPGAAAPAPGVPAGAIQTGPNPVTARSQEEIGLQNKNVIATLPKFAEQGAAAGTQRDQVQQQRNALANGAATGWGADTITAAARIGAAFGWKDAENVAKSSGEFNKAAMSQVFANLSLQNGVQTEGDADRMKESLASLKDPASLTKFLLASMDASSKRIQMRSSFYEGMAKAIRNKDPSVAGLTYADIPDMWAKRIPKLYDMPEMKEYAQGQKK
jgi:hypothetical protein